MNIEIENNLTNTLDKDIEMQKGKISNIIGNILDKTADYAIKSMPIQDNIRDIIMDIKNAIKSKDIKSIIDTAVNSSLREGMEFLGVSQDKIDSVLKMKDILFKGGLRETLSAGIETAYSKYIKGNMFGEEINSLVNTINASINGKEFNSKLGDSLNLLQDKQNKMIELCKSWHKAYDELDIKKLNMINSAIILAKPGVCLSKKMDRDINIINNMTEFINNKNDKLTKVEMNFCNNI